MNKLIKITVALAVVGSSAFAQTVDEAKKAIEVEQFEKAKTILKKLIAAQPTVGENYFRLGRAYFKTEKIDSAKIIFTNGTVASPQYALNYVGLGSVDLEKGNAAAAQANFDKAISLQENKKDYRPLLYIGKAYTEASKPDYKLALSYLEKAKLLNPKERDPELWHALGNAHRGDRDNSAAYSDYGIALEQNKDYHRAKLELGVSVKMAKAYPEAIAKFKEIVAADPNYGPAYREIAETYYQWAKDVPMKDKDGVSIFDPEKMRLALESYEKFMDLTDRSLENRFRRADFLFLSKQWKPLEVEAAEMAKIDRTNLRVYRYLGITAFNNGNYPASIQAFNTFISKADSSRILGSDYMYLGKAQFASGDTVTALATLRKAIAKDSTNAEMMSDIGKSLYSSKKYLLAAEAYELALKAPKPKLLDAYWVGRSYFYEASVKIKTDTVAAKQILVKADTAFSQFIRKSPTVPDGYLFRARINRQLDSDVASKGLMVPFYEKFAELLETKGIANITAQNKKELVEAYNNLAAYYAPTDAAKSKALLEKTLGVDPVNTYAQELLKSLGAVPPSPPSPK